MVSSFQENLGTVPPSIHIESLSTQQEDFRSLHMDKLLTVYMQRLKMWGKWTIFWFCHQVLDSSSVGSPGWLNWHARIGPFCSGTGASSFDRRGGSLWSSYARISLKDICETDSPSFDFNKLGMQLTGSAKFGTRQINVFLSLTAFLWLSMFFSCVLYCRFIRLIITHCVLTWGGPLIWKIVIKYLLQFSFPGLSSCQHRIFSLVAWGRGCVLFSYE